MKFNRRKFVSAIAGLVTAPLIGCRPNTAREIEEANMYGLIAKMTAVDGKRDELSAILLKGLRDMPSNLSYIVAHDPTNVNDLWITEVWVDKTSHQSSLKLLSVQDAITTGRPFIAGMERIAETHPLGGQGL